MSDLGRMVDAQIQRHLQSRDRKLLNVNAGRLETGDPVPVPPELIRATDRAIERMAAMSRTPVGLLNPGRNPYYEGSFTFAWWEFRRALRVFGWTLYYHALPRWARR